MRKIQAAEAFATREGSELEQQLGALQGEAASLNLKLAELVGRRLDRHHPDRTRLTVRLQQVQAQISHLKPRVRAERVRRSEDHSKSYERVFIHVAREMLAESVYERLRDATSYRLEQGGAGVLEDRSSGGMSLNDSRGDQGRSSSRRDRITQWTRGH